MRGGESCSGKLSYFPTNDCSGAAADSLLVDNGCRSTNFGVTYASHLYDANAPLNVACTKTGSSPATTPALSQPSTVCCN